MERTTGIQTYQCYINGEWVEPATGEYFESDDPFTSKVWARIPRCGAEDVDRAVEAANNALTLLNMIVVQSARQLVAGDQPHLLTIYFKDGCCICIKPLSSLIDNALQGVGLCSTFGNG